jgi:hypothetical protein
MMYGNLMPVSKMPQPQMFVVPREAFGAGLGNDKFRTERLHPARDKDKVLCCGGAINTSLGKT